MLRQDGFGWRGVRQRVEARTWTYPADGVVPACGAGRGHVRREDQDRDAVAEQTATAETRPRWAAASG